MRKLILIGIVMILLSFSVSGLIVDFTNFDYYKRDTGDISINGTNTTEGMLLTASNWTSGGGTSGEYLDEAGYGGRGIRLWVGGGNVKNTFYNASKILTNATLVYYFRFPNGNGANPNGLAAVGFKDNSSTIEQYNYPSIGWRGSNYGDSTYFWLGLRYLATNSTTTNVLADDQWHKFLLHSNDSGVYAYENNFTNEIGNYTFDNSNDEWRSSIGFILFNSDTIYLDDIYYCEGYIDCSLNLNGSITYDELVSSGDSYSITLKLNKTEFITSTNATLYYNGSIKNTSYQSFVEYDLYTFTNTTPIYDIETTIPFTWQYEYNQTSNQHQKTFIKNITLNHTIYDINLTDCGGITNTSAYNFTIKDELTSSLIKADISGSIEYWEIETNKKTYGFNYSDRNNFSVCLYPGWLNLTGTGTIEYGSDGYSTRYYYFNNDIFDNATNLVDLLLLNNENTTQITVTVVDEYDLPLVNYIVKVYLYNLPTDSYTLIQTEQTNSDGLSIFNLDIADNQYQFVVEDLNGNVLLTKAKEKIIETSITLRVQIGEVVTTPIYELGQLDYTLNIDRTNYVWTLTWNDNNDVINNISLWVYKVNNTAMIHFFNTTTNNVTGTIAYTLTGFTNGTYIGTVTVNSKRDGLYYDLESQSIDIVAEWDIFGLESLLMAFFFLGVLVMIGATISAETALILLAVGLFVFRVIGMIKINWTALIGIEVVLIIIVLLVKRR